MNFAKVSRATLYLLICFANLVAEVFGEAANQTGSFTILSAASVNGHEVGICFNKPVDLTTAGNPKLYRLSDTNVVVTNAIVRPDKRTVKLRLSREITGGTFVLIAPELLSSNGDRLLNSIVAGGVMQFNELDNQDIGTHPLNLTTTPGSVFGYVNRLFSSEFEVAAGGSGIGGQSDAFHYVYQKSYQFHEIITQIRGWNPNDAPAQAGLMVRESTNPQSRHVSLLITSTPVGGIEITTLHRETEGGDSSSWPESQKLTNVSLPVWLSIQRDGNAFKALVSSNGFHWMTFATIIPKVGFATFPHHDLAGVVTSAASQDPSRVIETQYVFSSSPHGDIFPRIEITRHLNAFHLSWQNATVLESCDQLVPPFTWIPVTNHLEFGAYLNRWSIPLPPSPSQRLFRIRFPSH